MEKSSIIMSSVLDLAGAGGGRAPPSQLKS